MKYQYKVVPFIGQSRGRLSPEDVATQLENVISQYTTVGWEFYQLSDVNIEVQPGCLAGLFGAKVQYARFDQLIFRAEQGRHMHSQNSTRRLTKPTPDEPRAASKSRSADREQPMALSITSKHLEVWRQKSDEQVREAIAALDQYTEEGRLVILAEFERRSLEPVSEAEQAVIETFRNGTALRSSVADEPGNNTESRQVERDLLSYCYHCGADVPAGSSTCIECGKSL